MKFIPSSQTCVCVCVCLYVSTFTKKIYLHNEHTPIFSILFNVILKSFFIKIQLIYSVSDVQKNDSFIYIYTFFRFFSIIGYYKKLNVVLCAI